MTPIEKTLFVIWRRNGDYRLNKYKHRSRVFVEHVDFLRRTGLVRILPITVHGVLAIQCTPLGQRAGERLNAEHLEDTAKKQAEVADARPRVRPSSQQRAARSVFGDVT